MSKKQSSYSQPSSKTPGKQVQGGKFVDRNLMEVSPLKEQFEPAGAEPVRQHNKMAGGA